MSYFYIIDQSVIRDEFADSPVVLTKNFGAAVIGPAFSIVSYDRQDADSYIGFYDGSELTIAWPAAILAGELDTDYTAVVLEAARLQYAGLTAAARPTKGDSQQLFGSDAEHGNIIRCGAHILKTTAAGSRNAAFHSRDVAIGDVVRLKLGSTTLWSRITALHADRVASQVGAAAAAAANVSRNGDASAFVETYLTPERSIADYTVTNDVDSEPFNALLRNGVLEDTYYIEVTSTSGDFSAAAPQLTVTSDNGDIIAPYAFDGSFVLGSHGGELIVANTGDPLVFEVGMRWQVVRDFATTALAATSNSGDNYSGAADTQYIVTVSRGGLFAAAAKPRITVTTTTGIDAGGPLTIDAPGTYAVGNYGVSITFDVDAASGLFYGDRYFIDVEAAKPGAVKSASLAATIPAVMLGEDVDIDFTIERDWDFSYTELLTAPDWTQTSSGITLRAGIEGFDAAIYDGNADLVALPIISADAYVSARALQTSGPDVLQTYSGSDDALDIHIDNPLHYAVHLAWQNSGGVPVKYLAVATDTAAAYAQALQRVKSADVYSIAIASQDDDVIAACVAVMPGSFSSADSGGASLLVAPRLPRRVELDIGTDVVATVIGTAVDIEGSGSFADVAAGDRLRYAFAADVYGNPIYSEAVIAEVVGSNELVLTAAVATDVTMASKIEVWRQRSAADIRAAAADFAAATQRRNVLAVFPDRAVIANSYVSAAYIAAAIAGLRSTLVPQRRLTGIELLGFDGVPDAVSQHTTAELRNLVRDGLTVVSADAYGRIFVLGASSTDTSSAQVGDEATTRVIDTVVQAFLDAVLPFRGIVNLTPQTLARIRTELQSVANFLTSSSAASQELGPLVNDITFKDVVQHPVLRDRLIATFVINIPTAFSEFELVIEGLDVEISVII